MVQDFKKFIMRGNVLDLAVAVIIGSAFGKIVSSMVNDVLMPLIGLLLGRANFTELRWVIRPGTEEVPESALLYGQFIQNVIDFVIIAFVVFLMVRAVESMRKKPEAAPIPPAAPPADILLLTEIRDLLKR